MLENIEKISIRVKAVCERLGLSLPFIFMEPGRSIVAASGMTLYKVGATKMIEGFRNYVSIDGGMADNPRYTLYSSPYTVALANKMNEAPTFNCTVAGRCCESGDLIQENVDIPHPVRGDYLAVATTGAYNYSMASNYNKVPRPAVVFIKDKQDYLAIKRETYQDLMKNDI